MPRRWRLDIYLFALLIAPDRGLASPGKGWAGSFSPLLLMGMRFLIAATVLVWLSVPPYLRQICGISFIAATLQYGLTFSGLARMDTPAVLLLVQAEVIFGVIIAALLLGEKPSMRQVVGIAISVLRHFDDSRGTLA